MRRNDLDKSFRDKVAAFNFVGISKRVEELEASSVPNREARLSIMLGCVVDRVRLKLSLADSELGAASTVTLNNVQLRTPNVGPTLQRRGLLDFEAAKQQLEGRVVDHFTKLVREIELALNSQNFLAIATHASSSQCTAARDALVQKIHLRERQHFREARSAHQCLRQKPPHWCTQRCRRNHLDTGKDASGDRRRRLRADTLAVSRGGAGECAEVSQPFSGDRGSQVPQRCHGAGTPTAPSQSVNGFRFGAAEDAGAAGELRTNFAERLDVEGGDHSDVVSRFGQVLGKGFGRWNFSGIQRNSCSSLIFTTGTVFFSETSWLRCSTGLWQRFPFTRTGCGERHCSPPNPWRVEAPLEAGRGDEHEGTDGVEPPKPLRMLVSFCVCGLAVQNMNAFGSLFARYDKWSQTMRGFCGVRPDASRLAGC